MFSAHSSSEGVKAEFCTVQPLAASATTTSAKVRKPSSTQSLLSVKGTTTKLKQPLRTTKSSASLQEEISYINDQNNDRSFLRGDLIAIEYKNDSIYIAGDGETPQNAEWIVSAKKIKDGKVSKFRKEYNQPIKYHYSKENEILKTITISPLNPCSRTKTL